jgi:hypothetical protein
MSYQKPQVLAENPKKMLSMEHCWGKSGCPGLRGY